MATPARGLRQSMSDLHIWTGLLAGWILYAMFLTGTVSYFRDEISQYMRPELVAEPVSPAAEVVDRVTATLLAQAPDSPLINMSLPTARDPLVQAYWRTAQGTFGQGLFDPLSGQPVQARDTLGGDFFYGFHFQLHYVPVLWGRWIAGLCAMFMLVAIISGVITHKKIFKDFFTFRWGKGQRSWLDAHTGLSVLGLPFHFMITYSGLLILMVMYMPWGMQNVPAAQSQEVREQMGELYLPVGQPAGQAAPLVDVGALVRRAEQRWGAGHIDRVQISNAGDANARVALSRLQTLQISTVPRYLLFDGATGALLGVHGSAGPAATTQGVFYGLHMGRFADTVLRWLYFLISLGGTAMVGTGLVLWTVKRRAQLPDPQRPHLGFRLVERLNITAIAGLSVAMAAFFWGNRLLPEGLAARGQAEINLFFLVWGATFLYALVRPAKRAWVELLWLATALLALLPVLSALVTTHPLWHSLAQGNWVFAGFDMTVLALALGHGMLAYRTARHRDTRHRDARAQRRPRASGAPPAEEPA